MRSRLAVLICILVTTTGLLALRARDEVRIVTIGRQDRSFAEFSRTLDVSTAVVYRAGTSTSADWPAYHPGTFDAVVGRSTMERDWTEVPPRPATPPLQISFDLAQPLRGAVALHLDAIVRHRRPAAPRYVVSVNGRTAGSYRIEPRPAPELWWPNGGEGDGNLQYFGYATLDILLPASHFAVGANTLESLECVDGFGIFYDDLSLTSLPDRDLPAFTDASVDSTILYKQRPSGLVELAAARLRTTRPLGRTTLRLTVGDHQLSAVANQDDAGDLEATFEVPVNEAPQTVTLHVDGIDQAVFRGTFTPKRRWTVYALPMEQADFGYNDLPARTLEWENRFIDKALAIQERHPLYSFTLDAAANLDSYLATRQAPQAARLVGHLQSGRWGLNALYGNFFTGLMTPEERYRSVEFAVRSGKRHSIVVDSASQTDEPSVTWAMPQVLADAGIRVLHERQRSDPRCAQPDWPAQLQVAVLLGSPERQPGARVERRLLHGHRRHDLGRVERRGRLERTLRAVAARPHAVAAALSLQYERADFPFDAVQLFGLHNDEIPMRHWGDADVLDLWNREFAYPKIVAAPQRDFFKYITSRFGDRIQTLKGDGGAYWEDEAGADARIAALIRAAQAQLVAAETFESIALWLQPHLRFDPAPFDAAWHNIMLADSYVWSDANSFRRPDSYRTREGEAAHRAWAEAAFQQTKDLRLVAMDKIAELVRSDRQGAVVFNPESRPRTGLFDYELEPGEALEDPVSGAPLPCGVVRSQNGYHDVRCMAADVPATGYRFYAVAAGRVPVGEPVSLDPRTPAVETAQYSMQLDPVTGAIVHLVDKATGVELVNAASGYRMNEYPVRHGRRSRRLHSGQCEGQPPARGRRHPARARAHGPPRNADGAARGAAISVGHGRDHTRHGDEHAPRSSRPSPCSIQFTGSKFPTRSTRSPP